MYMAMRTAAPPLAQLSTMVCAVLLSLVHGPSEAAIVTSGQVSPDPATGAVTGRLVVGNTGLGTLVVNGGSNLTGQRVDAGSSAAASGAITVSGAGSSIVMTGEALPGNLFLNNNIGSQGQGSLSVLNGGNFTLGNDSADCQINCRLFFSNGAGSSGALTVDGAGSALNVIGGVRVGYASFLTLAAGGFNYGQAGGASTGTATVSAGGAATSSVLEVGRVDTGFAYTGAETATGNVIIDGMGSVWTLLRNAAQTGSRALLDLARERNNTGTLTVSNGGALRVNGAIASGEFTGINVAAPGATATATGVNANMTVSGAGSQVEFTGGRGFLNVGRSAGANASLTISNGGVVSGGASDIETGLTYTSVGQAGQGTATITGTGSLLRLNGRNSSTNTFAGTTLGGGAFLSVGRGESNVAGTGSLTVSAGGRLVVDTEAVALTNASGQSGFAVGRDVAGTTGTMTVTGAGSLVQVKAGTGMAPVIQIGRDGANGQLTVSDGGQVQVTSQHVSVPNLGTSVYLPGDVSLVEVGRRSNAGTDASAGTLTITGAGSAFTMGGAADALMIVGRGTNATGTVNVLSGGLAAAHSLLIGQDGGVGTVNVNGGRLQFGGVLNGGPSAGQGGGISVGRGGTGVLNIAGASVVDITSTAPRASFGAAASTTVLGGSGFINVSGGSTVTVTGPEASVGIGRTFAAGVGGTGQMTLSGVGTSVSAVGANAQVLIGGMAGSAGTVVVGSGSTLSATSKVGVAHDETGSTAGTGVLVVNGQVNASQMVIGTAGLVAGSGVINANVTNLGLINPGNSPGRLTINGALDNSAGKIVLEIKQQSDGTYAYDEIVVGDWASSLLGGGAIEFKFLDDIDPDAFLGTGDFKLSTFFKEDLGGGHIVGLDASDVALFQSVAFSGSSSSYSITGLSFGTNGSGSATVTAVPVPQTLALGLLALALLGAQRRLVRGRGALLQQPAG